MTVIVKVGMADAAVAHAPNVLRTLGLGSCIGIALYDPDVKVAGLSHIMLPSSEGHHDENPAKYANTGVPHLLEMMEREGAKRSRIKAKIAGGAQMFHSASLPEIARVGPRNVEAVRAILQSVSIEIIAQEVGGSIGRTVELDAETGLYHIKTAMASPYAV